MFDVWVIDHILATHFMMPGFDRYPNTFSMMESVISVVVSSMPFVSGPRPVGSLTMGSVWVSISLVSTWVLASTVAGFLGSSTLGSLGGSAALGALSVPGFF